MKNELSAPALNREGQASGATVTLTGHWNLQGLERALPQLRRRLEAQSGANNWDLRQVAVLDSAGAVLLWHAWGRSRPPSLSLKPEHETLFEALAALPAWTLRERDPLKVRFIRFWASPAETAVDHFVGIASLIGELAFALGYLIGHPQRIPWLEISATIRHAGVRALGITAIVGLLIGVVISYLSAMELKYYGAQAFIVNVVGLGVVRELGPLLAAILVAGRSGSAITAQLGVMRVTEELDALNALGISPSVRLVLPRAIALAVIMPLLVIWTDAIALIGGMLAANAQLHISFGQFLDGLPVAVPIFNFWMGLGKGIIFGIAITVIACHFGLRIRPDTESLGAETTNSVVTAITTVIIIDALFAVVFNGVGWW